MNDKMNIYPNPANELLQIAYTIKENETGKLSLTDVSGKLVCNLNLSGSESRTSIDLSGYQDGIYFVHLYVNGRLSATQKVVVSH